MELAVFIRSIVLHDDASADENPCHSCKTQKAQRDRGPIPSLLNNVALLRDVQTIQELKRNVSFESREAITPEKHFTFRISLFRTLQIC